MGKVDAPTACPEGPLFLYFNPLKKLNFLKVQKSTSINRGTFSNLTYFDVGARVGSGDVTLS